MSIMGYYDGTAVYVDESLEKNQKVIVIPVESKFNLDETAAGGLHKYADQSLLEQGQAVKHIERFTYDRSPEQKDLL